MQSCCGSGYERWATKSLTLIFLVYENGVVLLQDRLFAVLASNKPATTALARAKWQIKFKLAPLDFAKLF
jgi:hypothetical protein